MINTDSGVESIDAWLVIANDNPVGIGLLDHPITTGQQAGARVTGYIFFYPGSHQR